MPDQSFSAYAEALDIPIVVIGADDRIVSANQIAQTIFGSHILGRLFVSVLRQPELINAIVQCKSRQQAASAVLRGQDGLRETRYDVSAVPVEDTVLVAFYDKTEADHAAQMRREFVANVSHELRTPLTSMTGFIETLRGPAKDDAAARDRFLEIMASEALRMRRLVDDLLSLSRVEEEARRRPTASVAIRVLLSDVIDGLQPQAEAAGAQIMISGGEDSHVIGDHGQLVQLFTNLAENALKYGAKGGDVAIRIEQPDYCTRLRAPAVKIEVADKGEGIKKHHIPRLTERFYRVDDHRSRAVGGTGLGLAIVKHIVSRHRGYMKINSVLGQGTTVTVVLPAAAVS